MTELGRKIKDLKDFIKKKTDQGTANYLGKEIREICGMVESEQLLIHSVVEPKGTLNCQHEWIVNTHQKTKYCRKGCNGFKEIAV